MWGCKPNGRLLAAGAVAALLISLMVQAAETGGTPKPVSFLYNQKEVYSSRYASPEPDGGTPVSMSLDGFDLLFENNALAVYIREETGALRVCDKASGYVWGSLATDKPDNLNKTWSKLGNALIAADIFDKGGVRKAYGTDAENLDWRVSGNSLTCHVTWEEEQIELDFTMTLTDDGLQFDFSGDSVKENGDCRLSTVYFLPFFGSSVGDEQPGYVFLPDGCGSLVRFQKPRSYLQGFEKRVYGPDYGIDPLTSIKGLDSTRTGEYMTEEELLTAPLFGMVHGAGQNAFYALAESGGAFASLRYDPAGLVTDYHRAYMAFTYRQTYEQPFNKGGEGIQTVQADPNRLEVTLTYRFLHGQDADYVGMAKSYRSYLRANGLLSARIPSGALPLQLDFLVADVQKEFIGTSVNKATDLSEIEETVEWLTSQGLSNLQVNLLGWQKGGLSGYQKTAVSSKTVYGRLSVLDRLRETLVGVGGRLSLWLSPLSAREGQADVRSEIGISMSQTTIVKPAVDDTFLGDSWYLKTTAGLKALTAQVPQLTEEGYGTVIDDIGYLLYGEYLSGSVTTRDAVQVQILDTAAGLAGEDGLTLVRPADYLYRYAAAYLSMPMVSSQYLFQTDTVPFLQTVLAGSMELYAPYTNLSFFSGADILKMIDYGCAPSFLLTGKDNYALRKTASSGYRSTKLDDWTDYIVQAYGVMAPVLEPVRGQEVVSRSIPQRGVSETVYTGGRIYVNYNAQSVEVDGLEIPGASAVFTDGDRVEWGTVA